MVQHRGEIVEKAVRESGYSITRLAKRMGKSRRWMYQVFDNANVPIDYVIAIGDIIHYDFSEDIKELRAYANRPMLHKTEESQDTQSWKQEAEHWKNKYLHLLEKYNELLLKERK